jgi:hypothetical protein
LNALVQVRLPMLFFVGFYDVVFQCCFPTLFLNVFLQCFQLYSKLHKSLSISRLMNKWLRL